MTPVSRNTFVLFLLCVVLLIVVGVAFPSYLSRKNIKLRSTFNSSVVSFNALSSEKLISGSTGANLFNTSKITFLSTSNGVATKINTSRGTANSSLMPLKVKRRLKRQTASDNDSELFDWNFHINVTRYRKVNEEKSEDFNNSVKRSGVAVYLQSKEPKKIAFNEMQTAFKSVKSFLRDFFKISFENVTNDTEEKREVQYFTESPWVEPGHTAIGSFDDESTKTLSKQPEMEDNETHHSVNKSLQPSEQISSENINKLELDSGSNDSSIQTDREARIFFGLFNLGGKSLRKTTPEPETPPITDDMNRNIAINNLSDPLPQVATFVTENSQKVSIIHADSFRPETEKSVIEPNEQKAGKSDLHFVTQKTDCLSCNTDETENPNLGNEKDSSKTALETPIKPIEHLTDKTLRNLCMQILKESETPFNEEEKAFENQLRSSQNHLADIVNSPITNEAEELNTRIEIGDNLFSSEESRTENTLLGKQARFLSIFGLGSGRSEIINEGNLIFEKEPDEPKFTNLPSISDCEKFSKDWKREINPKRNPTSDLITTPDFHELNPNQGSENMEGGISSDENKSLIVTEVSLDINKDQREIKSDHTNTEENKESSNELLESKVNSKPTVKDTTDGPRDGRIFSFFDFGSGNGRDANMTDNRSFFGFFSSGMRSLDSSDSDESNDLGSGIPFKGKVSVDEGYQSEEDIYEDISATSIKEHRFLGIFGIRGSGEGREIADSTDSITEYNDHNDCENDCSHEVTEQPYECNDNCDLENYDITNSSVEFSQTNSNSDCVGNCNTSIAEMHSKDVENLTSESLGLGSSVSTEILLRKNSETKNISIEATDECDDCDYENFINLKPETETEASSFIIKPTEQIYENTYFGEDHDKQIHSHTSSDISGLDYYSTEKSDHGQNTENSVIEHETTEKSRRFMGTIFLTGSGDGGLFGGDDGPINLVQEENTFGSNRNPRRRGRLDDTNFNGISQNLSDDGLLGFSPESNSQDLVPLTDRPKDHFITDKSGTEEFSPVTFLASPNITQIQIQPRSCAGARDCNATLNERCITVSSSSICDCGRSFVRHKETGKCVAKKLVVTSLKLPKESFVEDLRNPASPRYKQMTENSLKTIYLLLNETPNILRVVTDVNIAGFASGSLIVKLNLVLAAEKGNPSQNLKDIENELQQALKDEKVMERAALNVRNASFLPLESEVNLCKSSEMNYCSKYADCIWNENYPEEFLCKCKEHYLDVSDSFYPGEVCLAICPASFCGTNGHCEISGNKKHCVCYGLYFGERCEFPGVVILGSLSIVALISLIIVFVVILKLRYRSTNYGRTPTFRRADTPGHAIANCRVSDAIALGESREMKASKFVQISTPVQEPPLIKVTRPTLNESSISFDCDSTFDVSNHTEEKAV